MNELKMATVQAIQGLLLQGWSHRHIARTLGINRETVSRYAKLQKEPPKPAIPTAGSEPNPDSNPAISTAGPAPDPNANPAISTLGKTFATGRKSSCDPFASAIRSQCDLGLTAQRIFQDLVADQGFTGSYSSVKRFVRRLEEKTPLPFRRMEVDPGAEAQVDFGSGYWLREGARRRKVHVLRVVLSHSRKAYSEAVRRQTADALIRLLENAFRSFGGCPKTLVPDNLKAAVLRADWYDPDLNPKLAAFCRHYGIVLLPTKPYTPRHKGKVEKGIDFVQSNALKGKEFPSLGELNRHLAEWERTIADTRIHGTTRAHVGQVFTRIERPALLPLPLEPFPLYEEGRRKVHRDGHVEIRRSYYSVPPEYLGREVWVQWDPRIVRISNDRHEQIALHPRVRQGAFHTDPTHIPTEKISIVERGVPDMLRKSARIGVNAQRWGEALLEERGLEGIRVLQGFLALARHYPAVDIERTAKIALERRLFRLRLFREVLSRLVLPATGELTGSHPIIRPLSEYQKLLGRDSSFPPLRKED